MKQLLKIGFIAFGIGAVLYASGCLSQKNKNGNDMNNDNNKKDAASTYKGKTYNGTVKDYTGLDGCGMIIELDNGTKLEPLNVEKHGFTLKDGQRVKVAYKEAKGMMSICMVGVMADILFIEEI